MSKYTVEQMRQAIDAALKSYDNNRTWSSGELVVETAEAYGGMGSASAFKSIDRREFAERVLAALDVV